MSDLGTAIEEVQYIVHANAKSKGFWDHYQGKNDVNFVLKQLAMIHSEISEVLEAVRKEKGDHNISEEFADTLIRIFDLYEGMRDAGYMLPRLGDAIDDKIRINNKRPRMHGVLA